MLKIMTELTDEMSEQRQQIKQKLLDGSISAISADTCIFSRNGYQLNQGILGNLKQFHKNSFRLIFSEVTIKEVIRHIGKYSEEEKTKFHTALRGIARYWSIDKAKQSAVSIDLFQGIEESKELANKQVEDFLIRCGANVIDARQTLDVSELLKCYFETLPPFETSRDKKAEFPDAIALLSLESWAKKEKTSVLFVTKDKGCTQYCKNSSRLYAIDDLASALTLIQERDSHRAEMCASINEQINLGKYPDLLNMTKSAISQEIWSIDWAPRADSAFYYDSEMQDIEVLEVSFLPNEGSIGLQAVDYYDETLVARMKVSIKIEAWCNFDFSVKDGIDKDMVFIGSTEASVEDSIKVDVLISILDPENNEPEICTVELIPTYHSIDFGSVWPDYEDENPNSEYY